MNNVYANSSFLHTCTVDLEGENPALYNVQKGHKIKDTRRTYICHQMIFLGSTYGKTDSAGRICPGPAGELSMLQ